LTKRVQYYHEASLFVGKENLPLVIRLARVVL